MKNNGAREFRIDNIRALAILTVVLGHSMILYSSEWGLYRTTQTSAFFDLCKRVINLYQMPLFLSLSGYLYARTAEGDTFKRLIGKKLPRLLIPFFAIGLFYMIPIKLLVGYPPYQGESVLNAVLKFLNGQDVGHLWYLPVLFVLFLCAFPLARLFGNRKRTWTVACAAGLLFAVCSKRLPLRSIPYVAYFAQFSWSFFFGALLFHMKSVWEKAASRKSAQLTVAVCALLGILAALYTKLEPVRVLSGALIMLALYMIVPNRSFVIAERISKASFGLYLLHSPLIYITFAFLLSAPPVLVFGVNAVIWGGLAYLETHLLSRSPLKLMIGG